MFRFLRAVVFAFGAGGFNSHGGDADRRDVEAFMMAFDTTLAPIVGQQITLREGSSAAVHARIDLLLQRAQTPFDLVGAPGAKECDLIVKGATGGYRFDPATGLFQRDSASLGPLSDGALRAIAASPDQELTYTCVPPGAGVRSGIDRDEDGALDADDTCPALAGGNHSDVDADARGAACDNCPGVSNPDQSDSGGVGAGCLADGIGDPCQCGDLSGEGVVTSGDPASLRAFLAGLTTPVPGSLARCSVIGSPTSCDVVDGVVLRRALGGLPPAPGQVCDAATL